ncbi:uncharacterized protein LOC126785903 [Argentina anserina]|uniref:uncharacterized protein LOC126785903 n=1 Tax=Argentina anserina TaxID=57926 RepID=UPI00217672F0|nr:uncharacterized protein LOC126785903 [Potentilla anserina]
MGNFLKYFVLFFCTFLFFFTIPISSSSPNDQTHSSYSSAATIAQYQVFQVRNTAPFLLDRQQRRLTKNHKERAGSRNKNPTKKSKNSGPFSVMLPKGFVPPSGSSPCHNGNPNDVVVFCDLAKP